jgi:hypothetical protein
MLSPDRGAASSGGITVAPPAWRVYHAPVAVDRRVSVVTWFVAVAARTVLSGLRRDLLTDELDAGARRYRA